MADKDQAMIAKLVKLVVAQGELLEKFVTLQEELDNVLAGRAGIAEKLHQVELAWLTAWSSRYHSDYVFNYAKDRAQWKRLLKTFTAADLQVRILGYIKSDDPFYANKRHPFGLFVAAVNSFTPAPAFSSSFELGDAVGDCQHKPRCLNDAMHTRRRRDEMAAFR